MGKFQWMFALAACLALAVAPERARAGQCIDRQSVVSVGAGLIGWAYGGGDAGNAIAFKTADGNYHSMSITFNANDSAGRFQQDALLLVLANGMRINAWDHANPACSAVDEIEIIKD